MKREVALQIRLTRGEYDILKARAGGTSLASYVRSLVCVAAPVQGKPYVFKSPITTNPVKPVVTYSGGEHPCPGCFDEMTWHKGLQKYWCRECSGN